MIVQASALLCPWPINCQYRACRASLAAGPAWLRGDLGVPRGGQHCLMPGGPGGPLREGYCLQPLVLPPVGGVGVQPQDSCCRADRHLVRAQLQEPALHPAVSGGAAHAGRLGRLQDRGSAFERRPERGLDRGGTSQVMTAVASG